VDTSAILTAVAKDEEKIDRELTADVTEFYGDGIVPKRSHLT